MGRSIVWFRWLPLALLLFLLVSCVPKTAQRPPEPPTEKPGTEEPVPTSGITTETDRPSGTETSSFAETTAEPLREYRIVYLIRTVDVDLPDNTLGNPTVFTAESDFTLKTYFQAGSSFGWFFYPPSGMPVPIRTSGDLAGCLPEVLRSDPEAEELTLIGFFY